MKERFAGIFITAVCAVALGLLGAWVAKAQTDRLPVELYNPAPVWPAEIQDVEGKPEVSVEVQIDTLGRVAEVTVLGISPTTEFDAVLRGAVEETLSSWRYSPKLVAGEPQPATLRWSFTFSRQLDTGLGRRRSTWSGLLEREPTKTSLLELPLERRQSLLAEQTTKAVARLDREKVKKHQTARFTVYSDREEALAAVSQNAEALFSILDQLFAAAVPPVDEPLTVQIVVFENKSDYSDFLAEATTQERSFNAMYFGLGLIAFHLELPTSETAVEILLHELTHAYTDRHLTKPGVRLPYWLVEGFAEYIGNSKIKKGELLPGKVPRGFVQDLSVRGGQLRRSVSKTGASFSLDEVRQAARKRTALTLGEMLEADRSEFYGDRLHLYYAMSWLLVHYLRHGEPEWGDQAFPDFLLFASEGFPIRAAFEAAYGKPPAELEEDFRTYVAEF